MFITEAVQHVSYMPDHDQGKLRLLSISEYLRAPRAIKSFVDLGVGTFVINADEYNY